MSRKLRPLLLLSMALIPFCARSQSPEQVSTRLFSFLATEKFESRLGTRQDLMASWLTSELYTYARVVECDATQAWEEKHRPLSYVDAGMFFDAGLTPAHCKARGSSRGGETAVVRLKCGWGNGPDDPQGNVELSVHLRIENGKWKVANVVHNNHDTDETKTDLTTRMQNALRQSKNPDVCATKYKLSLSIDHGT